MDTSEVAAMLNMSTSWVYKEASKLGLQRYKLGRGRNAKVLYKRVEVLPRMNSLMEPWVQTCRHELLDRTLIWNERHLRHALRELERHHNAHRPHQAMHQAAPLRTVPEPITDPERMTRLNIRRNDRIGGVIHEYRHAA